MDGGWSWPSGPPLSLDHVISITVHTDWSLITPGFQGTVPGNFLWSGCALGVSLGDADTLEPVLHSITFYTAP
jgi:hypothetical protein